ncbi:type IV toxin-antitoxin system AbiEi family antitoxin domain-containing protein [Pseudomonas sp. N040]|uniref:type IV toxin-antitoxin system AbiEi family antitoxin domain-containing protein n=1 Tax=Pseudomonas sp. N040 TaxID=2785325 RepID=UPI0018A24CB5|nr:hypothetical protein [Pseudomonas sp. N040]MBF7730491.1 hypothetical protein [Pseudomonas sp. N040]MBW7014134.1 hypothetical protein [Pseudomonas sp. N040]
MRLIKQLQAFGSVPFTHGALLSYLGEYRRPNDKIARLLAAGDLVQLKKGLYVLGAEHRATPVSLPLVANLLYGPSCVSLDFALSWHGLIPEGVFQLSSVTPRRSRQYDTPLGVFSYAHIPAGLYGIGVQMEQNPDGSSFLLAGAEKALCDKLLLTRNLSAYTAAAMRSFLLEDLRMDIEDLARLDLTPVRHYLAAGYKPRQLQALCKLLESLQ